MVAIYLKAEGRNAPTGESQEQGHVDWIVLKGCSLSASRSVPDGARATQRTRGETEIANLECTMDTNRATLKLFQNCASGVPYDKITIHIGAAGGDPNSGVEVYMEYIMFDALIQEYSISIGEDGQGEDTFQINYSKIESIYNIADRGGNLTKDSTFKWDKEKSQMA